MISMPSVGAVWLVVMLVAQYDWQRQNCKPAESKTSAAYPLLNRSSRWLGSKVRQTAAAPWDDPC